MGKNYLFKSSDIPEWKSRGPYPLGSKANNKKHENNNINTCLFTSTSLPNFLGHSFFSMASNSQVLCDNDIFHNGDQINFSVSMLCFVFARWYVNRTLSPMRGISPSLYPPIRSHSYSKDSHSTGITLLFSNSTLVLLRLTELSTFKDLWDGTSGLLSLSEKTRKSNHLQMKLQRQHFLLSYLKTLRIGPVGVSDSRPPASQPGAQPSEPLVHGASMSSNLVVTGKIQKHI